MRMLTYAKRCMKEILRDPITICFGICFPIVLLLLLSAIQANVPVEIFKIEKLTPGITIFGLSFMTLFSATLISKDRESAFLQRLYTTPLKPFDYILGYMLPLIPISVIQSICCYITAIFLKLPITINIIYAVILIIPISIFFISIGLLFGSIFNSKQASGICGGLFTNLSAWLSGAWFDISLVGGFFTKIANVLPFVHAVELEKQVLTGNFDDCLKHIIILVIYIIIISFSSILVFLKQMKNN